MDIIGESGIFLYLAALIPFQVRPPPDQFPGQRCPLLYQIAYFKKPAILQNRIIVNVTASTLPQTI
ncbi:MAG: hypothetical protein BA866_04735 [Desulfobulbaceae bacterium S5133MH15]|nr:MAG: hypothetical protein BA866_04735 [Desulfobulbaceae bacterium S5133MH15]